jgi:hypothetical protein
MVEDIKFRHIFGSVTVSSVGSVTVWPSLASSRREKKGSTWKFVPICTLGLRILLQPS